MRCAVAVTLLLAGCGSESITDISCKPMPVYLDRTGGVFNPGAHDDAITNTSVLLDVQRTLEPWPGSEPDWRLLVDCITEALRPFPRLAVTETDPGAVPHVEIVFTTSYWAGAGTNVIVPASCRPDHEIEIVFGDALPTYARACHVAMQAFAQMTGQLGLGDDCHDFVNNSQDCSTTRAFLDQTVSCVDVNNQPVACRCTGESTQNTYQTLATTFPACD